MYGKAGCLVIGSLMLVPPYDGDMLQRVPTSKSWFMGTTETWRVSCYRLDHRSIGRISKRRYALRMQLATSPPDYMAIGVALLALSLILRKYAR